MREYKDYKELKQYVKSNIGFFLGCGPSISNITKGQWKVIHSHDIWASNFFIWNEHVPDFYHAEIGSKYMELWIQKFREKGDSYKNVKFIIHKDNPGHPTLIGETPNVFKYKERKVIKNNKECILSDDYVTHSNNASLTLVLDIMRQMGYKKIILFGVDLNSSTYFWTGKKNYGKVHLQTNKNMNPNVNHTTCRAAISFTKVFNHKWMNGNLYTGHTKTMLYPQISFIDIEKEL